MIKLLALLGFVMILGSCTTPQPGTTPDNTNTNTNTTTNTGTDTTARDTTLIR